MDNFDSRQIVSTEYRPSAISSSGSIPLSIEGEGLEERVACPF